MPPSDREPSIGIDLGTTNSAVATVEGAGPIIIERATGQRLLPSLVGIAANGLRVVGEEARLLAETMPQSVAFATKRFIGRRWSPQMAKVAEHSPYALLPGAQKDIRVRLTGQVLSVVEVAATILSELRSDAEAHFDRDVHRAVITVPANFNDAQRQATRDAASIAGLEVLRLINEPTAAALAFGLQTRFTGHVVVFDLGGGTFDVSILDVREPGNFDVIATGGDPAMGGEDFDSVLVEWLLSQLTDPGARRRVESDHQALARLKAAAEEAKKTISLTQEAHISLVLVPERAGKSIVIETLLTHAFFDRLVQAKTELCLGIVERTMAEAKLQKGQVDAVLLVGGMTRIPLLRKLVNDRIGPLAKQPVNPDEAVALGAALHAAELDEPAAPPKLHDVVGATLGVGIAGGLVKPLIRKNAKLPCSVSEVFTPSAHGATSVHLPIVQGEGAHIHENSLLGDLTLDGLLTVGRGANPIQVTFDMGVNGTLDVSVHDQATGQTQKAQIAGRTALSSEERDQLQGEEAKRRDRKAVVEKAERDKNRQARRALHDVLVPLRRMHRDGKLKAYATGDAATLEHAEALARMIVEAEKVEQTGTRERVGEVIRQVRELLAKLASSEVVPGRVVSPERPGGSGTP